MKVNKYFLVIILILTIFTLSFVSASDINSTDDELGMHDVAIDDSTSDQIDNRSSDLVPKSTDEVLGVSDSEDLLSGFSIEIGEKNLINLDTSSKDIEICFPNNAKVDSYYSFYLDNKLFKKDIIQYKGFSDSISLDNISCGKHSYKVVYKDNKNNKVTKKGSFKVDWKTFELDHYYGKNGNNAMENISYGDKYKNSIALPDDANANVRVIVNNKKTYYFGVSDFNNIVISDLEIGKNEIVFEYSDEKYDKIKRAKDIVNVYGEIKGPTSLSCLKSAKFTLKLPNDANGTLVAYYPNGIAESKLVNGSASVKLPVLSAGQHQVYVYYNGSDYQVRPFGAVSYVNGTEVFENQTFGAGVEIPSEMTVGAKKYLKFNLPGDANGVLKINNEKVSLINGSASISLSNLSPGKHTFTVRYSGDSQYPDFNDKFSVAVNKKVPVFNITVPNEIIAGLNYDFTFTGPSNCKGTIALYCGDDVVYADLKKGKVTLNSKVPEKYGKQSAVFSFVSSSEKYYSVHGLINFTSIPAPVIQADDLDISYTGSLYKYKARILDGYGKHVGAGEKVKVCAFDDDKGVYKVVKTLKTDKKGYIQIKIDKPSFYFYKFNYKGVESREVTLGVHSITWLYINGHKYDQILSKSSKKIDVEVHLKNHGEFIKKNVAKKKVKVKFNGKTYTAKTNSEGIAKLTIKQKAIKKLKVGEKYLMSASYNKDTDGLWSSWYLRIVK